MLNKQPKTTGILKFIKNSAKTLFVIEAVLFAGSYYFWYQLNTSKDYRKYINDKYPIALEYYYKIGEVFGDKQRELDLKDWNKLTKPINNKID